MTSPAGLTDGSAREELAPRYWAFISYSSVDERHAVHLHRRIEGYRIPARVQTADAPAPRRLRPVFRDRSDLPAAAELGRELEAALARSRYLIVVCSPNSAASPWVGREIEAFRALGRGDRILAYVVEADPPTCFHPALLATDDAGRSLEPLAADARPNKDGHDAALKLIAGMLGVGFDALKQRDLQARLRRMLGVAALALTVACLAVSLATWAIVERGRARRQTVVALSRLEQNYTAKGLEAFAAGRAVAGLPWLCQATQLAEESPGSTPARERSHVHRLRLGLLLRSLPQPLWRVPARVQLAAWSPDGRLLATAAGGEAWIWDVASRRSVAGPIDHPPAVTKVVFCPHGRRLLTICGDPSGRNGRGAARVWNAADGSPVGTWLEHEGADRPATPVGRSDYVVTNAGVILDGLFSRDGTFVATASDNRTARLWDAATGALIGNSLVHPQEVVALGFGMTADGECLITACRDDAIRLWTVPGGRELAPRFPHQDRRAPLVHESGLWLTTIPRGWQFPGEANEARVFSLLSDRPAGEAFRLGSRVAAWRHLPGHASDGVNAVRPVVLVAGEDGRARCWTTELDYVHMPRVLDHDAAAITDVQACGAGLVLTCGDGARLWHPETGEPASPLFAPGADTVAASLGSRLVLTCREGSATMWRIPPCRTRVLGPWSGCGGEVRSTADGRTLVTRSTGETGHVFRAWDGATGDAVSLEPAAAAARWAAADPLPDVAAADHSPPDLPLAIGTRLRAVGRPDGSITIEPIAGGPGRRLQPPRAPLAAAFDPHERLLAVVGAGRDARAGGWWSVDLWVQAWDVASGEPLAPAEAFGVATMPSRLRQLAVRFIADPPSVAVHAQTLDAFVVHSLPMAATAQPIDALRRLATFQAARRIGPDGAPEAVDAGLDVPPATGEFDESPAAAAGEARRSAANAIDRGRIAVAEAVMSSAEPPLDPASALAPALTARRWLMRGEPRQAVESLSAAIDVDDSDPVLFRLRAEAHAGVAAWSEAVDDLGRAARHGGLPPNEAELFASSPPQDLGPDLEARCIELAMNCVPRLLENGRVRMALGLLADTVARSRRLHEQAGEEHAAILEEAAGLADLGGDADAAESYAREATATEKQSLEPR